MNFSFEKAVRWLDGVLEPWKFDDASNNGVQIGREGDDIKKVAFAVDASVKSVRAAIEVGAELLVVHHGISWGGGIKRLTGEKFNVVKAAVNGNLAIYASHLPLDANSKLGNNRALAREFALKSLKRAFSYHGNVLGFTGILESIGKLPKSGLAARREFQEAISAIGGKGSIKIGVCSGGAGEFAAEAKELGCDLFVTGEASWGDVIAAENCAAAMVCLGHYETEVFGVRGLAKAMKRTLGINTVDLTEELR
ncbi:MAG: Nif3-like dinuclear metal center hexameric protein [Kiritimatiellae bacterium]|nr:Nif3-like dinuclear metal center hexameric protein [Kiritimatiellia bacterium]